MKRSVKYLLSFFLILGSCFSFGQSKEVDSLLTILKTAIQDTTRVNIYNKLFLSFEFTDDTKAQEYLNNALKLSKKVDYKKGIDYAYTYFGFFAEDKGNYPEALRNYFISLKVCEEMGDKK